MWFTVQPESSSVTLKTSGLILPPSAKPIKQLYILDCLKRKESFNIVKPINGVYPKRLLHNKIAVSTEEAMLVYGRETPTNKTRTVNPAAIPYNQMVDS